MPRKKTCTIHGARSDFEPFACDECKFIVKMFKDGDSMAELAKRTGYRKDGIERRIREFMVQLQGCVPY